ncbi:MAG: fluoride efflux transporter CrcB [Deltaproteobacteria bacterium]|nr:fluoride efflux transporter CrcB [Deltaproteobacteria bacterium]
MIKKILLIGFGGFAGSVARYFVSRLNLSIDFYSVPIGTMLANVLGCYIIGLLTGIAEKSVVLTLEWRLFLMVGFCGGFTTFSSFANENLALMHSGQLLSILIYTGLSIFLGFLFVYLGYVTSNAF